MPVAKEQIRQIIAENNLSSITDVYVLLKDSFKDILQELMEALNIPKSITLSVRLLETAGYAPYFCLQKYGKCRNHNQACFVPLTRQGLDNVSYICRYNQKAELSWFP